jgi:hypothetical protein
MNRSEVLAWEQRLRVPTALAAFGAVAFLVASIVVAIPLGGGGPAEGLRDLYEQSSRLTLVSALQGLGFLLLVAPLVYLYRAGLARSERMRKQFLPLVVAAPIALAVASVLNGVAADKAATAFVDDPPRASLSAKEARADCRNELRDDASGFRDEFGSAASAVSACAEEKVEDDSAESAIEEASPRRLAEVIQFAGLLALAFALVYSCLHAMRVGLLTRFWGALGMAIGVASVLGLFQLGVIWFLYFGLLLMGWIPGGRPPAWAAGEAIPWPTPGDKAAEAMEPPPDDEPHPQLEEPEDPTETEQSR